MYNDHFTHDVYLQLENKKNEIINDIFFHSHTEASNIAAYSNTIPKNDNTFTIDIPRIIIVHNRH